PGTLLYLAALLRARQEFAQARALLEQAAPHHQQALKSDPGNASYRQLYLNNRIVLVLTLASLGDSVGAKETAEQLASLGWEPPTDAYNAACVLAECIP